MRTAVLRSVLLVLLVLLVAATAQAAEARGEKPHAEPSAEADAYESYSLRIDAGVSAIRLSHYAQKREWGDRHDVILKRSAILSVNGFHDEGDPRISITTSETIIDGAQTENRIYWVSLKNVDEVDLVIGFLWKKLAP